MQPLNASAPLSLQLRDVTRSYDQWDWAVKFYETEAHLGPRSDPTEYKLSLFHRAESPSSHLLQLVDTLFTLFATLIIISSLHDQDFFLGFCHGTFTVTSSSSFYFTLDNDTFKLSGFFYQPLLLCLFSWKFYFTPFYYSVSPPPQLLSSELHFSLEHTPSSVTVAARSTAQAFFQYFMSNIQSNIYK